MQAEWLRFCRETKKGINDIHVEKSLHGGRTSNLNLVFLNYYELPPSRSMGGKLREVRFFCHVPSGDNLLLLTILGVMGRSRGSSNSFAVGTCNAWNGEHDDPSPPPLVSAASTCPK